MITHKLAVVKTLHSRVEAIRLTVTTKDQETKHIKHALTTNGYPEVVIQHHSRSATHTRPAADQPRAPGVTLPYIRGLSETVRRILTPRALGVRVSLRPYTTLRQLLVRPKDCVPTDDQAGVVSHVLAALPPM